MLQLTPILALLLSHDLLISKHGVVAPANHVLKLAITRHKARLNAEITKTRIRGGYATLEAFKQAVNHGTLNVVQGATLKTAHYPRWVRINTLKTTLEDTLATTFAGFKQVNNLQQLLSASGTLQAYFVDPNIPNLLALSPKVELSKSLAYLEGCIIFQDKASCFPAYLLDVRASDGNIIDGCAAPGNKTTHLTAFVKERMSHSEPHGRPQKVIAFERDESRAQTLDKMVQLASASDIVSIKGGQDFLAANPISSEFADVGAILLDPSCSGSGIVGRDDALEIHLPNPHPGAQLELKPNLGKKRKRDYKGVQPAPASATLKLDLDDSTPEEVPINDKLSERLSSLSTFQLRILTHAMSFPKARKITYSTCSVHFEENEGVIFQALDSIIAKERGWRILKKEEQVEGLKKWTRRGAWEDGKLKEEHSIEERGNILEACIRCEKGTTDGTMGFFVAAFVRDDDVLAKDSRSLYDGNLNTPGETNDDEEEWNGFSDENDKIQKPSSSTQGLDFKSATEKHKKRKRNKRTGKG